MKPFLAICIFILVACNANETTPGEAAKDSANVESAVDENKERLDYAQWVEDKRKEARNLNYSEERMDQYLDSLSVKEYFKNGVPAWYNDQFRTERRRIRDSVLRIERETK